jgi:hypothetical protein
MNKSRSQDKVGHAIRGAVKKLNSSTRKNERTTSNKNISPSSSISSSCSEDMIGLSALATSGVASLKEDIYAPSSLEYCDPNSKNLTSNEKQKVASMGEINSSGAPEFYSTLSPRVIRSNPDLFLTRTTRKKCINDFQVFEPSDNSSNEDISRTVSHLTTNSRRNSTYKENLCIHQEDNDSLNELLELINNALNDKFSPDFPQLSIDPTRSTYLSDQEIPLDKPEIDSSDMHSNDSSSMSSFLQFIDDTLGPVQDYV